ncbi:MAG TPA: MATE family efflux transporter [Candidatus Pygmaiobacter gallistercoris]|nr:MATE family efflux transporter [Candidatus Pygmaiobacter gallistercoris]
MQSALSRHIYTDWSFYKGLLAITLPIALQNIISLGVNMMDTVMLGQLGDVAIAAANLGGQPFMILNILGFGLASGGSVLIAQYWGRRDLVRIRQLIAMTLRCALAASVVFCVACLALPRGILSIYSSEPEVIRAGAEYLSVLAFSFLPYSVSNCYIMCLRAVEQVKVSMVVYGSSFFVNVFFNWCFIFGNLGCPALGVRGAAIGTLIARCAELIMVLIYMVFFEKKVRFLPRDLFDSNGGLLGDFVKNSVPVISNELLWGTGFSVLNMIMGHLGSGFVAAYGISNTVNQMVNVFIFGMCNATAVTIGRIIGEGRTADARRAAWSTLLLSGALSLVVTAVLLAGRGPILSLFSVTDETRAMASTFLGLMAVMSIFQSLASNLVVGVLRGGGDVRMTLLLDCGLLWVIAIPLGLVGAFVLELPAALVFVLLRSDNIVKTFLGLARVKSGRWVRSLTREEPTG